jgi:UDP-glucose 4-epimerase
MANVLVTGGAGFIGSHIVAQALGRGDAVRVLDNFSTGRPQNLDQLHGKLEVLEGDLRDPMMVKEAVRGVELAFHQAAFVSVPQSMQEPETCFAVNVAGTVTLLEAARRAGVRRVVLASSTAVYGDTDVFPTGEQARLQPLSPYAVSKQVDELYARLYTHSLGLPVVALRYFNVYGPRQRPDSDYAAAIPIFIRLLLAGQPPTIFGDGKQTRDFIFVEDVARANLLAAECEAAAGEAFNVCTGGEISMLDLLEQLSELAGRRPEANFAPPRPGDIYRSVGDPAKAERLLGFRAETPLAEGLNQTIEWMRP